jgi:hypothetical protein
MTNEEKRLESVRLMKSREKRNSYTNGSKRQYFFGYPQEGDNGYSDCSSAVRESIRRAAGIYIGSNTDAQIRKLMSGEAGKLVDAASGDRIYPNESVLKPGDCLYFRGNKNHVKQVGHVEMYTGKNECYGHGSGTGPRKHNLKEYCEDRAKDKSKRYLCAVRWIPDDADADVPSLQNMQTATSEWPIYKELPKEPEKIGFIDAGDEVRVYGEVDGYYGIKTVDGLKGFVRKEAFEPPVEVERA